MALENQVLNEMTALVAHERIMIQTSGEAQLVKIALASSSGDAIKVKTLTGKELEIDISLDATIYELKREI